MVRIGIFLDDIYKPVDIPKTIDEWIIVKDFNSFCSAVEQLRENLDYRLDLVSFDHDLVDEHYKSEMIRGIGAPIFYSKYKEPTGLQCAKWLIDYYKNLNIPFPKVAIHTDNVMGGSNIMYEINKYKKEINDPNLAFNMKWKLIKQDES